MSKQFITLDKNGEYTLEKIDLTKIRQEIFFDKSEKIVEFIQVNGKLTINLLTNKQVNLFLDIDAEVCTINAIGPICIDSKLDTQTMLTVNAESAYFADVISVRDLKCTVKNELEFAQSVTAVNLQLQAAQCNMTDNFHISGSDKETNQCVISGVLTIAKNAVLELNDTYIDIGLINNLGQLTVNNCECEVDRLQQRGLFFTENADITLYDQFSSSKQADTTLKSTIFSSRTILLHAGKFTLDNVELIAENCDVLDAQFLATHKTECHIANNMVTLTDANFQLIDSQLLVDKQCNLNGQTTLQNAFLYSPTVYINKYAEIIATNIRALNTLTFTQGVLLEKTELNAQTIHLQNNLEINNTEIHAATLTLDTKNATVKQSYLEAQRLNLYGGGPEQVSFTNSKLVADFIVEKGHVNLDQSTLIGIGDKNTHHLIQGQIELKNSRFITHSQIYAYADAKIGLIDHSTLQGRKILNEAEITLSDSQLFAKKLQNTNEINAKHAAINIKKKCFVREGNVTLTDSSTLFSNAMQVASSANLSLQTSYLKSNTVDILGEMDVEDSKVSSGKFGTWLGSKTTLTGDTIIDASNKIRLRGDMHVTAKTRANKTKAIPQLKAQELETACNSKITGDNLTVTANNFSHAGGIYLTENFQATGGRLDNFGSLSASKKISLLVDDAVLNIGGTFSTDNMTVNGNFINALGWVNVRKHLTISGFINLNFGAISANNINSLSLFSCNGFMFPNFSADRKYLFSSSNLRLTAKSTLSMLVPGYANAINLAFMLPLLKNTAINLYNTSQKLTWNGITSLHRHEIMPLVGQLRNAWNLGNSAYNTMQGLLPEIQNTWENGRNVFDSVRPFLPEEGSGYRFIEKTFTADNVTRVISDLSQTDWSNVPKNSYAFCKETFNAENISRAKSYFGGHFYNATAYCINKIDLQRVSKKFVNLVGPHYLDTSIMHINTGVSLSQNTTKTNFVNHNYGVEASIQTTIDTGHFKDRGYLYGNTFNVTTDTADLEGSGDISKASFDIAHLADGDDFIAGNKHYARYQFTQALRFSTQDNVTLEANQHDIKRDCDIGISGSEVSFLTPYAKQRKLSLNSTSGDVKILDVALKSKTLEVNSAGDICMNNSIRAEDKIKFLAKGIYYNRGGILDGDKIFVKATTIKNITGVIRARRFGELLASENIENLCTEASYQGKHDIQKQFVPGRILGGDGQGADGIGLYMWAGGKYISDASIICSDGENVLNFEKGAEYKARTHTYTSEDKTTKSMLGLKKKNVVKTTTDVASSMCQSGKRNTIVCTEGDVETTASVFTAPLGTTIYAKEVSLFSLKTQDKKVLKKSSFGGLNKSKDKKTHATSNPTVIYASDPNGFTHIKATDGNADLSGAFLLSPGDLSVYAKKRILFGRDILDHEITKKKQSLSFSSPCLDIFSGNDATFSKANDLINSANYLELLANSSNFAIDFFNNTNNFMRGIANGNLASEFLARFGLGNANGFSPTITATFAQSKTKEKYQTLGLGGANFGGNVTLQAEEAVILKNGVTVHAGKNLEADTPKLTLNAAKLHSSFEQRNKSASVSFTPTGQVSDVSASYAHSKTEAVNHINSTLSSGGAMNLHHQNGAIGEVTLKSSNINAGSMNNFEVQKLNIIDEQDTLSSKSKSMGVSANGQVSFYKGKGIEETTHQQSGIHTKEGHHITAKETHMKGGKITSDVKNHFNTEIMHAEKTEDSKRYRSAGISLNAHDLSRLDSEKKPTNSTGENAIATATVTVDIKDYKATHTPVVHGNAGTHLEIQQLNGDLHSSSSDGLEVKNEKELRLKIEVPITNAVFLEQAQENIASGTKKILDVLFAKTEHTPDEIVTKVREIIAAEEAAVEKAAEPEKTENIEKEIEVAEADASADLPEVTMEELQDALQNLTFASKEEEQEFNMLLSKASEEFERHGKISTELEKNLSDKTVEALFKSLKKGSREGFRLMGKAIGKDPAVTLLINRKTFATGAVKSYVSFKSGVIMWCFNVALNNDKGTPKEQCITAAGQTMGDLLFGLGLRRAAGVAAGPIGWLLFGVVIVDTLTWNEDFYKELNARGIDRICEAREEFKKGNYLNYYALAAQAQREIEQAGQIGGIHLLAQVPGFCGSLLMRSGVVPGYIWNKIFGETASAETKTDVPPEVQNPEELKKKMNSFGFFEKWPVDKLRSLEDDSNQQTTAPVSLLKKDRYFGGCG